MKSTRTFCFHCSGVYNNRCCAVHYTIELNDSDDMQMQ